jgi:NADPH-dependent glutamate synthase beta subunit-like oxidoreductase
MKDYMDEHGYTSIMQMRDLIVPEVKSAIDLTLFEGYAEITKPDLAAPCKAACPHNVPAQAYVQKVAKGEFKDAYDLIMGKNPLQSVCGWVCSHPCETECTRGEIGTPIMIREIKRFVIEYGMKQGWKLDIKIKSTRNEKVAVIGSGPAGLSCAYNLAIAGYSVTVFEKEKYLGGMLRYGLPRFRMNHNILDHEIETLKSIGIKFLNSKALGKEISIDGLKADNYKAIFIGIGAQKGYELDIKGDKAKGVVSAIDFLKDVYDGKEPEVGKHAVVIGGGFTAVDAARTAKRLGAEDVYIAYRRTKDEMPASEQEIIEAEEEGVKVMYLVSPKAIQTDNNRVTGIKLVNQVLGDKDVSNRRRPEEVTPAEFILPCDIVIVATGQKADSSHMQEISINKKGMVVIDEMTGVTNIRGVYAGGDTTSVDTVIGAIAAGKKCACSIDKLLAENDSTLEYQLELPVVSKDDVLKRVGYFKDQDSIDLNTMNGKERLQNFSTYVRTMTEEEAVKEAKRCLNCGCGEGCGLCARICSEFAIHVESPDIWKIDEDECVACGMCYNRCPNGNIEMINKNILEK